jgi:hypothetical protein
MAKSLNDTLQQQLDKNDPTQRAIGLLATLVDNKLEQMVASIEAVSEKLEEQERKIGSIDHARACPNGIDQEMARVRKIIEPLNFITDYPKLAGLMFLGLMTLLAMGTDKLFELIKTW